MMDRMPLRCTVRLAVREERGDWGGADLCLLLLSNASMTSPKQGNVPSLEVLGKHAWAADNIVLFPFPLCVPVTPFTKPSASTAATVPSARVQYIRVRGGVVGGGCRELECAVVMKQATL